MILGKSRTLHHKEDCLDSIVLYLWGIISYVFFLIKTYLITYVARPSVSNGFSVQA